MTKLERPENLKGYGVGGWLSAVQVFMWIALATSIAVLLNKIIVGTILESIVLGILSLIIITAIIQFYRKRIMFRLLVICYITILTVYIVLTLDWSSLDVSEYSLIGVLGGLVLFGIIMLFISQRVKKTFCEKGRQAMKQNKQDIVSYNIALERNKNRNKKSRKNRQKLFELNVWITFLQIHFISALCSQLVYNYLYYGKNRSLGVLFVLFVVLVSLYSAFYKGIFYRRRRVSIYIAVLTWVAIVRVSVQKAKFDEIWLMMFAIFLIYALVNVIRFKPKLESSIHYWRILH